MNCEVVGYPVYVYIFPTACTQYARPSNRLVQSELISGFKK